jgi:hypothetical protein
MFEALTEDIFSIGPDFVRSIIAQSPVTGKWLGGLTDKEISMIEIMIEQHKPVSFEELSELLVVSRVAVAGYMQRMIERRLAVQLDCPGKKKLFQISDEFRGLLV